MTGNKNYAIFKGKCTEYRFEVVPQLDALHHCVYYGTLSSFYISVFILAIVYIIISIHALRKQAGLCLG